MDRYAIKELGIPEEILMENAGLAAISVLQKEMGIDGKKFLIFCGIGNNGGDGFVVARKILSLGGDVKVHISGDPSKFKGAAKIHLDILSKLSIPTGKLESTRGVRTALKHSDCVVDALFGTGLDREVAGLHREIIFLINENARRVLSLDIPSGINGDTGAIMGVAVKADWTVSFGLPKLGNLLFPSFEHGGRLYVSHISFPPSLYEDPDLPVEINGGITLPARSRTAHKGTMGDVLFIAGAAGYFGAPYFSAMSFMKAGGGYSRLAAPHSIIPFIARKGREIVFVPQKETTAGSISYENKDGLLNLAEKVDMVVIGPGLSLTGETQKLVRELVLKIHKPVLLDGDGITAVADEPDMVRRRKGFTILTPHPGEMARLMKISASAIESRRIETCMEAASSLKSVVVLKGAHTLIGTPEGRVFMNLTGNPGMATAGSGDVLTGTIAAMFGLGLSVPDAARKGVFIHGLAGDLAAEHKGEDGMTAQDILEYLPLALRKDREGFNESCRGPLIIP
jgi:NAD(P)H-hydrate epimerase